MSVDYFIHKKNGIPLTKDNKEVLQEIAVTLGCKIKTGFLDDGKLDELNITWEGCECGLDLCLGDRNEGREDTDKYFYGYWVDVDENTPSNLDKTYKFLYAFCYVFNLVYEDPQRDKDNLQPMEFINPNYSKGEKKEMEDTKWEVSPEAIARSKENIKSLSHSIIFALGNPKNNVTLITGKYEFFEKIASTTSIGNGNYQISPSDPSRASAEEVANNLSVYYPVIYIFKFNKSVNIVFYNKKSIVADFDYDSSSHEAWVNEMKKNFSQIYNVDASALEKITEAPNKKTLNEFTEEILKLCNISGYKL